MKCTIREARIEDSPLILTYIKKLAEYEKLLDKVQITEEKIAQDFFQLGIAKALLVETEGRCAGFAVYYFTYSTFAGKKALYLEDLFIDDEYRHRGFAGEIFSRLKEIAAETQCIRLEWNVLTWNEKTLSFYRSLGAKPREDWQTWVLEKAITNDRGDR